jgi:hypothetical protein
MSRRYDLSVGAGLLMGMRAGTGDELGLHHRSRDDSGAVGSPGTRSNVTDPRDPPPRTIETTVAIMAHSHVIAKATVTPFRIRLIEACSAVLERLEAKAGPEHNIFAETGEVLFWLYAISNVGGVYPTILPGQRWARNRYARGQLLTEPHSLDGDKLDSTFRLDESQLAQHCWKVRSDIEYDEEVARDDEDGEQSYDEHVAGRPVIASLRAELARLLQGS